jgi:5-methylthioadenosine/S-adenosylhomocysteine deaminase
MHRPEGRAGAWNRREVLAGCAALGSFGALGRAFAQRSEGESMPAQGRYLIRNGFVLSMDPDLGDLPGADVLVADGRILGVGSRLDATGAEIVDAADMLVLPGLVETHWHIWTTLLRSLSGDRTERGYFPTSRTVGSFYAAADMYAAARLALAEAVNSGITYVHDWCHNVRSPEFARQALAALAASGVRGRFAYGTPTGHPNDAPIDLDDLARLHAEWDAHSADGRLRLGLAWRGVATPAAVRDYETARELGLPVSVHVNNFPTSAGGIAAIAERGLLGPHVQLIHAVWSSPEEIAAVAASGASVSISPFTELRIGFGFPMTGEYLDAGVPLGLSVDTPALSGNADMFAIMKAVQNVENGKTQNEFRLTARRVLELATIVGARSMGMDNEIGSLTAGKRADLILVDTRHVNLGVVTDPAHLLVEAAQPSNVDTVMIDGRILKRNGALTALDPRQIVTEARTALTNVLRRANWPAR